MLTNTVATKTWADPAGGPGNLSPFLIGNRALLIVSQSQEVHEQIENTLRLIRKAAGLKTAAPRVADEAAQRKVREALDRPTQIEFAGTPLNDVVDYLKDLHGIEIQLDSPALKEAGVDEMTPVTKELKGISLRSALKLMLDELQLKCVIHDGVLLITTVAKAERDDFMETRVYAVTDLLPTGRDLSGAVYRSFQPLVDLLTNTVARQDLGGPRWRSGQRVRVARRQWSCPAGRLANPGGPGGGPGDAGHAAQGGRIEDRRGAR